MIQTIFYGLFLFLDLTSEQINLSNKIKFGIIILCFCFVLSKNEGTNKSIRLFLRLAFFFTLISDLCLLILDYYYYGILSFIIVQQLYSLRIDLSKVQSGHIESKEKIIPKFLQRLVVKSLVTIVLCSIMKCIGVTLDSLLIATVFYFISIVTNVIRAGVMAFFQQKEKSNLFFAFGMILFLLCDINVGMFNLSNYVPLSDDMYGFINSISSILMWTFYAPSQVLIALSIVSHKTCEPLEE